MEEYEKPRMEIVEIDGTAVVTSGSCGSGGGEPNETSMADIF